MYSYTFGLIHLNKYNYQRLKTDYNIYFSKDYIPLILQWDYYYITRQITQIGVIIILFYGFVLALKC